MNNPSFALLWLLLNSVPHKSKNSHLEDVPGNQKWLQMWPRAHAPHSLSCNSYMEMINCDDSPTVLLWQVYFSVCMLLFNCSVCWTLCKPMDTRLPCPLPSPGVCSKSRPLSRRSHKTISSSIGPFSSCLQSFPASGSFPMSQFFTSGGQSTGVLASVSVLPMNIQDWFPLGLTVSTSLQSKGLLGVFSNTPVQKH